MPDGREPYETAVQHKDYNGGKMVIVACYGTKDEAAKGHAQWVKAMTSKPLPSKLVDVANAEVAQMLKAIGGDMEFKRGAKKKRK